MTTTVQLPTMAGETYEVRVRTIREHADPSEWSAPVVQQAMNLQPPQVTMLSGTTHATVDGQIDLAWNHVPTADSYTINYRVFGTTAWTEAMALDNSASFTGVAGSAYEIRVKATRIHAMDGLWSSSVSVTAVNGKPGRVTGLSLARSTAVDGEIDATWTAATRADGYGVQFRVSGITAWSDATPTGTSWTLSGIAGSTYEVRVRSTRSGAPAGDWSESESLGARNLTPVIPTGLSLSASSSADARIEVSWTGPTNADSWEIRYRVDGTTGAWTETTSTTETVSLDLTAGMTYEVQVRAVREHADEGSWTASKTLQAKNLTPAVPSGFTAASGSADRTIDLSWTAVPNATGYTYRWRITSPSDGLSWTEVSVTGTSATHTDLAGSTQHDFQIRADRTNAESSDWTSTVKAFSAAVTTNQVLGLTALGGNTDGKIDLTWTALAGATSYTVQRRASGSSVWLAHATVTTTSSSYTGTPGTTYEFRVRAGVNAWSDIASKEARNLAPAIPSGLTAASPGAVDGRIVIDWSDAARADGYELRHRVGSGAWTTVTRSTASYSLDGTAGTTYEVQVRSTRSHATSSGWTSSIRPRANNRAPGAPSSLSATASTVADGRIDLSWTAGANAGWYEIDYKLSSASTWTQAGSSLGTTYAFTGTAGQTYDFRVRSARQYATASAYSGSIRLQVKNIPPAQVTGLTVTAGTVSGELSLSWSEAARATGYEWQSRVGSGSWTSTTTTVRTATFTGTVGTTYDFRVRATRSFADAGPWSSTVDRQVSHRDAPAQVSGVYGRASHTRGTILVLWQPVSGSTSYKVQYRVLGTSDWSSATARTAITNGEVTHQLSSLRAGTTYEVRVQAVRDSDTGAFSNASQVVAATFPPNIVTAISVRGGTIEFREPEARITYSLAYEIQIRNAGGLWRVLRSLFSGRGEVNISRTNTIREIRIRPWQLFTGGTPPRVFAAWSNIYRFRY